MSSADKVFAGYIPKIYETYMAPMLFEPYAQDLARRLASRRGARRVAPEAATDLAAEAVANRFGRGEVDAKMQAHIVMVEV